SSLLPLSSPTTTATYPRRSGSGWRGAAPFLSPPPHLPSPQRQRLPRYVSFFSCSPRFSSDFFGSILTFFFLAWILGLVVNRAVSCACGVFDLGF
uniref:Uncharacterized protein n=1 Tax=Oryza brachyantha TaxID=4533 RepID=J3MH43_ORYBR